MSDNLPKQFIDADSHIEDHNAMFDFLDKEFQHRRPAIINIDGLIKHRPTRNRVWLIDGEIRPKLLGNNASCYATPPTSDFAKAKPISTNVQGILDIDEYLACLDERHLSSVVLYSTLFLHPVTRDPLFEAALMRSYNTWMAETCAKAPRRLKWSALIPMRSVSEAIKEVKRAAQLGASSFMLLATVGNIFLHDKRFDPVYAAIDETNIPLGIHVGYAFDAINDSCDSPASALVLNFEMSMNMAFFSFFGGGILDRFPNLKVGFLEAGAVWLPAMLDRMSKWRLTPTAEVWPAKKAPLDYIKEHQIYFTVEGDEPNLRGFIDLVGIDRILGSADFPHVHYEGGGMAETFQDLLHHSDLTDAEKRLILHDNSFDFYNYNSVAKPLCTV